MDNQNINPQNSNSGRNPQSHSYHRVDRHSSGMATASLVLGITAVLTSPCVLTGIALGALAIVFGILSRGGQMKYSTPAIIGIVAGAFGIVFGVGAFVFMTAISIQQFGGIDGFIQEYTKYLEAYGIDTSALKSLGY